MADSRTAAAHLVGVAKQGQILEAFVQIGLSNLCPPRSVENAPNRVTVDTRERAFVGTFREDGADVIIDLPNLLPHLSISIDLGSSSIGVGGDEVHQ
jgi:hypothetical protein